MRHIPAFALRVLTDDIDNGSLNYGTLDNEWKQQLDSIGYTPPAPKPMPEIQAAEAPAPAAKSWLDQQNIQIPGGEIGVSNSNVNPDFAQNHPTLNRVLGAVSAPINRVMENPWMKRAGQTGAEVMTTQDNPDKVSTGNRVGDVTAGLFGGLMGFAENPASLGAKVWKGGENLIGQALPLIPRLGTAPQAVQSALKIAGASLPYEATMAGANNRPLNAGEASTAVGSNVLLDLAFRGAGKGIGAARSRLAGKVPELPAEAGRSVGSGIPQPGNQLLGQGSISAAKNTLPDKLSPTGSPNEYVRSLTRGAAESPAVDREVKDILWWDLQPGEKGTYQRRSHEMLATEANRLIEQNPEAAYLHAKSTETLVNEPDLSAVIGIKMADHYQKLGEWEKADEALAFVSEQATKWGQGANATKALARMSPLGMQKTFNVKLGELNKEGLDVYGPEKWKDVELTLDEKEAIGRLQIGDEAGYKALYEQIQARIGNELPSSAMEKVNAWRHISMLLNLKTQIRNIGGNAIMLAMRRTARSLSGALQSVLVKPEARTQVFSVKGEYKEAAAAHFEANKKELLGGPNKYNENIKLNMPNKRVFADHTIPNAIPLLGGRNVSLEGTRKLTYKLLEMGDTPFFKNAYVDRLASFAQAKGIKDFSKLPKEAFEAALKEAEQATYKDANKIATALNKFKNPGAKASRTEKGVAWGLEAAVPFVKTPINIVARGMQYSPLSVINTIGKWKTAEGVDELAKGLTGTAVMGLGYLLAKYGVLTGKANADKDIKAYDANAGNSPFSVLGKYTYDWAQPFAIPLAIGVAIQDALKENPLEQQKMETLVSNNDTSRLMQIAVSLSGGIYDTLAASGDTVFNMSIMKGIKDLLGNQQGPIAGLANLPGQYASQFIPTLSSQIAGMVDPTVRQSYVSGNIPASIKATLLNKIPFASKMLPAKQTPYGEDVKREPNIGMRAFSQFLSPGIIATDQNVKPGIDAELRRLGAEGLKNQFPTMTPNYIEGVTTKPVHPRINLTPDEATAYQKRTGQLTEESFNKLLNSGAYQNAKADKAKMKSVDEVKADMMAKSIADAKAKAKAEIVKGKGYK
jgi:hypothetical protein